MKRMLGVLLGGAFGVVALAGQAASAAPLEACPGSFTADGTSKVFNGGQTAASACQIDRGTDNNDVASIAQINESAFLGFSDWQSNSQTQLGDGGPSGTWTILNANFELYDYIIVFKDGAGTSLTAFLFNEEFASGNWSTPFTEPPFDFPGNARSKDVSHYTIALRHAGNGNEIPVPEPGALGLLGLGAAVLGLRRRLRVAK